MSGEHDFDWLVIGSGFGGSVSALRLAEKGYRVAVLESGRRYEDEDFAETTWNARRYYWLPRLGLRGIFRMTLFKDVFVVSGCGVGGGSLGYANTLYRPRDGLGLLPRPAVGRARGLGGRARARTTTPPSACSASRPTRAKGPPTRCCASSRPRWACPRPTRPPASGSSSASPARPSPTRTSAATGPPRAGCIRCGACMVGCRHNAKNTLVKNYLWFAERNGVEILPERTVAEIRPLGAADGSDGYAVTSEYSGAWFRKDRRGADGARRRRRRRRARHQPAAPALPPRRLAAAALGAHRPPSSAPTARRSPPSRPRTTATTSPSRSRSPRASIPTPTPTSRTSPTAPAPTRSRSSSRS